MDIAKERLENAIKSGAKGIKFQPLLQHFFPDEKRMYPIYERCVEHDMVTLFHTGMVAFRQEFGIPHFARYAYTIPGIDQIAADFPTLKIVICHMGGNYSYKALVTAEKHENIFMDTAYLGFFGPRSLPEIKPIEFIYRGVRFLGAERILFGTEGILPKIILESELSEREKKQILGLNAMRLLGLSETDNKILVNETDTAKGTDTDATK